MTGWQDDDDDLDWDEIERLESSVLESRRTSTSDRLAALLPHPRLPSQSSQQNGATEPSTLLHQTFHPAPESMTAKEYAQKLFGGQLPPPTDLATLSERLDHFRGLAPSNLGPLPPPFPRCPGVYNKGCGGQLNYVKPHEYNTAPFWGCEKYNEPGSKACSYRFYPSERVEHCQMDIVIAGEGVIEVCPSPGAEDAVKACGGVATILTVIGVDMGMALEQNSVRMSISPMKNLVAASDRRDSVGQSPKGSSARPGSSGAGHAAVVQGVRFPLSSYNEVKGTLAGCKLAGKALLGKGIPKQTLQAFKSPIAHRPPQDEVAQRYASLPPHLESALLPFQREGVRFGLERGGRCLIADEMGVGKTVQAIALAACYRCDSWPLLVVCPASLRLVWAEELEKWLPDLPPGSIHIINDKTDRVQPDEGAPHRGLPAVTITSYRMLEHLCCGVCKCDRAFKQRVGEAKKAVKEGLMLRPCMDLRACMASFGWRMLIVDESHTLRTTGAPFDAQHTEAVWAVGRGATRIVLLSGTPSLSKPFDLFRQIDVLRPGLLGKDKFEFSANYCNRRVVPCYPYHEYSKRWDNSGLTRAGELHLLLREEVMVRRLKRDVLDQLPPKRRQIIRLQKPKASEWPKEGTQGRHRADDSDAEDGDEDEGEGGEQLPGDGAATAEAWASAPPRRMSAAHRTGIAKCRDAAEWLVAQLGLESGAGEDAGEGDGEDTGADGDADLGNDGGGSAGTSADGGGPSKFIVFAHHRSVMNRLAATLDEALSMKNGRQRFYFVRIDGETDQQSRREAVERFRSDASVRVALLSVTAAGTGLDFSAASAVVFVELPSEVSLVRQAEDRAHRQGQGRPVNVYFLCARGTCDERHWQRLSSSLAKVTFVHDGPAGGGHIDGPAGDCGHAGHQGEGLKVDAVVSIGDDDLPEPSGTAAALPAQREGIAEPTGRTTPVEPTELEKPVGGESTEAPKQEDVVLQEIETFEQKDAGDAQQWWFEVSAHTHRVHFHAAADRTQRVNLSLPLEALCVGDAPCLGELITAVTHQLETAAVGQGIGKPGAVVSGIGPVAVDLRIIHSVPRLRSAIAAAKAFAREWRELKAADRSRLVNKVLQPPLEAAVEEVLARAESSGAFGTATERFADKAPSRRKDVKLPEGATWQQTEVYYQRYKRVVQYDQAVILPSSDTPAAPDPEAAHTAAPESAPGPSEAPAAIGAQFTRLCINCMKAVPGGSSAPVGAVLQTPCLLFCGPECEKRYAIRSSGTVGRRRVFQRDRGVCETCSLDCGTMVRRLQAVERGTKGWRERRRRLLQSQYPTFVAAAGDKSIDALVERATPGHAWQADHIVAVYLGGGQCDVDNLRTLCTACHKKRTKKQALERARERRGAKKDAVANGGQPARLRGKRARGAHIDSDSDGGGAGLAHEGAAGGGGQRGRGRGMRRGRQRGKGREGGGEDDSAGVGEIEVIDLT